MNNQKYIAQIENIIGFNSQQEIISALKSLVHQNNEFDELKEALQENSFKNINIK